MTATTTPTAVGSAALLRRGRMLEGATLAWNVVGIVVLAIAAIAARSVARWPGSAWTA